MMPLPVRHLFFPLHSDWPSRYSFHWFPLYQRNFRLFLTQLCGIIWSTSSSFPSDKKHHHSLEKSRHSCCQRGSPNPRLPNHPTFFLKYFFMFWSCGLHVPSVALFGPILRPITSSSAQTFHDGHRAPTRDAVILHHVTVSQHRSMNCHVPVTSAAHHFALDPPLGFLNRLKWCHFSDDRFTVTRLFEDLPSVVLTPPLAFDHKSCFGCCGHVVLHIHLCWVLRLTSSDVNIQDWQLLHDHKNVNHREVTLNDISFFFFAPSESGKSVVAS